MTLPEEFTFSQSSLQDFADCPSRFQLRYLLRQRWPAPEVDDLLEYERNQEQGAAFHRLVQQHLVGIPAEALLARLTKPEQADLRSWFETYLRGGLDGLPADRRAEVTLTVPLGEYALLAKFDLLAVEAGGRAVIVDWKTGDHLPKSERLARRLQTIVYRYVLAKGGDHLYGGKPIPPEQIEMVYWYAALDGATRRFPYDAAQMAADEAYLLALVAEIDDPAQAFPLTPDEARCRYCVYRSLHDRGRFGGPLAGWEEDAEMDLDFELDLEQIVAIEF